MRPITAFRAIFLFALLCCGAATLGAQSALPCPAGDCACILRKADQAAANPKTFQHALDLYFAVTSCDETKADTVEQRITVLFQRIEELRKGEEKATKSAKKAQQAANQEKAKSDSTASAALRAARRAYANDLAYKSTIALRDGDRNTAFRLAEFAHRYVEADNPKVVQALIDALYYYDNPDPARPPLPRVANLEDHTYAVSSVAFSPDGKRLATGSSDYTAKIWDLESGKALTTLEGHTAAVSSVAFSPDGKRLATGSSDYTAKIWDLESPNPSGQAGKALTTLEGHTSAVSSVAFSPDGKRLATGSSDYTAKIWDLESPSPSGQAGKALTTLEGHASAVLSVAFSPDGKRLATGSSDNTAKIWDLESPSLSGQSGKALTTLEGHTSAVWSMAFSPDGKRLATGSRDNTAKIWDLESPSPSGQLGKALTTLEGHTSAVSSVAFSPDGKRLATGSSDKTAKIWDLESPLASGQAVKALTTLEGHTSYVSSVAFSPDGKRLATGSSDYTAKIWDLESGKALTTLEGHTSYVSSVAFSPDGKRLATGSGDNTAKIWDLESPIVSGQAVKALTTLEGHTFYVSSVAFSPDGKRLATGSSDYTAKIWDLESPIVSGQAVKALTTLEGHTFYVSSVAFSPDGKRLATGSGDNTAKIWDLESPIVSGQAVKALTTLEGHTSAVSSVAFSPDGKRLATGSSDKTAKIWDLESGKALTTLEGHTFYVSSVSFSPDGKRLATGSFDYTAKIWDLDSGKALTTLKGHTAAVSSVSFSPDGKRLATGSSDNTAKIWDLESGKALTTLEGHTFYVNSVAFSPDGKRLATGSSDNTAKIWEMSGDALLRRWQLGGGLAGLILPQLHRYNLDALLDQQPGNEQRLLATREVWQISAFAEFYDQNTRNSQQLAHTAQDYARAARLYRGAADASDDPTFTARLGLLYQNWAKDILESGRPDTARGYIELACRLGLDKSQCPKLWSAFSERTGKAFDFKRFLASEDAGELRGYGYYFFYNKKWAEARQLYEKAEGIKHAAYVLERLYTISEKTGEAFDFSRFLTSEDAEELRGYGDYFFRKENWAEARQLYEKAEGTKHAAAALQNLFMISEKMGEAFDFSRFLASEDAEELRGYGDYFFRKEKWVEARQLYEKAEGKQHSAAVLKNLFTISEKAGEAFDFSRFLASEDVEELRGYGDYFFRKEKWAEARQLYEKAEGIKHSAAVLKNLFTISEKTGDAFDFNRFLALEDAKELRVYGYYFFEKEKWAEARQLYEKAEGKQHSAAVLKNLFAISEKTGDAFDFSLFLASEDAGELGNYATFFTEKANSFEKFKGRVPDYQNAIRLREKQMALNTTAALRVTAANEYNSLGYYQLFLPDGAATEITLRRAYELDPTNKYTPSNLAPALLLQGRWPEAEAEYRKWKDNDFGEQDTPKYRDAFLSDLNELEKQGVTHPDFAKARAVLKE